MIGTGWRGVGTNIFVVMNTQICYYCLATVSVPNSRSLVQAAGWLTLKKAGAH